MRRTTRIFGFERHLHVGQVVVGGQDDALGVGHPGLEEELIAAPVAEEERRARLAQAIEERVLLVGLDDDERFVELVQDFPGLEAEPAEADEHDVVLEQSGHGQAPAPFVAPSVAEDLRQVDDPFDDDREPEDRGEKEEGLEHRRFRKLLGRLAEDEAPGEPERLDRGVPSFRFETREEQRSRSQQRHHEEKPPAKVAEDGQEETPLAPRPVAKTSMPGTRPLEAVEAHRGHGEDPGRRRRNGGRAWRRYTPMTW
jgi:hypothetical protein